MKFQQKVLIAGGIAGALVGLAAAFVTTILGMVSIAHIHHSAGRLYGTGLALFDALLFPLLQSSPAGAG